MIRLVIFDLDGTLLNTRDDLGTSVNFALSTLGYPTIELPKYNMLVGRGILNLFRGALPEGHKTEENVQKMKDLFLGYYSEHSRDLTRPYDGIARLLDLLKDHNVKIAIASNKYQKGTEELALHYFPQTHFCRILGQRDGFPIKPDPEIIHQILRDSGICKQHTVYVGDSNVDMQTGINAGVRTIGACWGFRSKEELAAYSPWYLSDSPEDLLKLFEKEI